MRILWLNSRLMYPLDSGGRIRTWNTLSQLHRRHRVTVATLATMPVSPEDRWAMESVCARLVLFPLEEARRGSLRFYGQLLGNLFSRLPFVVAKYRSEPMREGVRALLQEGFDAVVSDFPFPLINLPDRIDPALVLFEHNVEAVIWSRHVARAGPASRWFFRRQWLRMQAYETMACQRADLCVAVSMIDAAHLRTMGARRVRVTDTGVDTDYFRPSPGSGEPGQMVFTGSMDWLPNQDGIGWWLEEVMGPIRSRLAGAHLTVVGRNPPQWLVRLGQERDDLTVTGRVDDIRPWLARGVLFVVPLRIAGGTRLKIFEAMAAGLPVLSTPIGAEGLPLVDGTHLVLAERPAELADRAVELLQDPERRAALSAAGLQLLGERFSWPRVGAQFSDFLEEAVMERMVTTCG